jgi:methylenetetrahydrofolate reductase (NADPH)
MSSDTAVRGGDAANAALAHAVHEAYMEVYPAPSVEERLGALPLGSYVAVTCSPTKGVEVTLDVCERLIRRGFRVVPHLAAKMVRDDQHLRGILARLNALPVDSVFVPGGDAASAIGRFATAFELLRSIADHEHNFRDIGVAAHPEGHPYVPDDVLMRELRRKQHYATYLVTQMCFDPVAVGRWLRLARARGVTLDAWLGVPGAAERTALVRTAARIGVGDSLRFLRSQAKIVGRMLLSNAYRPDALLRDLAPLIADPAMNVAGLHLYSFNQVAQTEVWRHEFLAELQQSA